MRPLFRKNYVFESDSSVVLKQDKNNNVLGGVFTVSGILDKLVYNSGRILNRKTEIGKTGWNRNIPLLFNTEHWTHVTHPCSVFTRSYRKVYFEQFHKYLCLHKKCTVVSGRLIRLIIVYVPPKNCSTFTLETKLYWGFFCTFLTHMLHNFSLSSTVNYFF